MLKHCITCFKYVSKEHFSAYYSCDACRQHKKDLRERAKNQARLLKKQARLLEKHAKWEAKLRAKLEAKLQAKLLTQQLSIQQIEDFPTYSYNERRKIRYSLDIQYRLTCVLRTRLKKALKNNQRHGSAINDLGCSVKFLKKHIEKGFLQGMHWGNYGNKSGQWSIDHIIPFSKVDLTNVAELQKVCHYTNLRPMWHADNIRKSNKI